ncbi:MAG: hypothetical protein R3195_11025 [Gemmatimonadota bacterium]|nr:hypothetical protein [Gemmatimonadota bacterium]
MSFQRSRGWTVPLILAWSLAVACETATLPTGPGDPEPGDPVLPGDPVPPPPPAPPPSFTTVGRLAFVSTRDGEPYIYLMHADGTDLRRLARGEAPAWSPDGTRIAFHTYNGTLYEVRVVEADGSTERLVVAGGKTPAWSHDGSRIAFIRDASVYVVDADGSGERLLVDIPAVRALGPHLANQTMLFRDPTWSRDGTSLAVSLNSRILVTDGDGSAPRFPEQDANAWHPAWSPDGSRIVVERGARIASFAPDGSALTIHSFEGFQPEWSSDGTNIAYTSFDGCVPSWYACPSAIWLGDPASDQSVRLLADPGGAYSDYDPAWWGADQ